MTGPRLRPAARRLVVDADDRLLLCLPLLYAELLRDGVPAAPRALGL